MPNTVAKEKVGKKTKNPDSGAGDLQAIDREVMEKLVRIVLNKNAPRKTKFIDECLDMCSMYFLDDSSEEENLDLGFFEDRVMLTRYFLDAEEKVLEELSRMK